VDAWNENPMRRMRMRLSSGDTGASLESVVTSANGRFSFEVRQGKYLLTAEHEAVRQTYGHVSPTGGFGSAVIAGPGQDTGHLIFRWYAPGAIVGTVTDDQGEPVERAMVQLIRSAVVNGRKRISTTSWLSTDDQGNYRFAPISAGNYYLAVTGAPWYSAALVLPFDSPSRPSSVPTPAFAPIYYPNALDPAGAAPLEVRSGEEARADFRLAVVRGITIQVNCPAAQGRSATLSLLSESAAGVQGFQRQLAFGGPSQVVAGVPPGRYTVRLAAGGDKPFSVRKDIEVSASDLVVDLTAQPLPSVTGQLAFKNPQVKPQGTAYIGLAAEPTGSTLLGIVRPDGTFTFPSVSIGAYRPQLLGSPGFSVSEVSAKGAALTDGVIEVVDGASVHLEIVGSDEVGRVKGFAIAEEKPLPGALVALVPRQRSSNRFLYQGFQTEKDGSFDFQNVPIGDYVLFSVTDVDFEYANPEILPPLLASGIPVHVDARGIYDERVQVTGRAMTK
jgi:hypothetical protein